MRALAPQAYPKSIGLENLVHQAGQVVSPEAKLSAEGRRLVEKIGDETGAPPGPGLEEEATPGKDRGNDAGGKQYTRGHPDPFDRGGGFGM